MLCQTLLRQASIVPRALPQKHSRLESNVCEKKAVLQGKQRVLLHVLTGVVGQRIPP
jgi:hypothetical protein